MAIVYHEPLDGTDIHTFVNISCDSDLIKEIRDWLQKNCDSWNESHFTQLTKDDPAYWEIKNAEDAMAFKLVFC